MAHAKYPIVQLVVCGLCLVALRASASFAADDVDSAQEAFLADDECRASADHDCALSALQLRGSLEGGALSSATPVASSSSSDQPRIFDATPDAPAGSSPSVTSNATSAPATDPSLAPPLSNVTAATPPSPAVATSEPLPTATAEVAPPAATTQPTRPTANSSSDVGPPTTPDHPTPDASPPIVPGQPVEDEPLRPPPPPPDRQSVAPDFGVDSDNATWSGSTTTTTSTGIVVTDRERGTPNSSSTGEAASNATASTIADAGNATGNGTGNTTCGACNATGNGSGNATCGACNSTGNATGNGTGNATENMTGRSCASCELYDPSWLGLDWQPVPSRCYTLAEAQAAIADGTWCCEDFIAANMSAHPDECYVPPSSGSYPCFAMDKTPC